MNTFEYKLITGPGKTPDSWAAMLNELGSKGWEFRGKDVYGQMVFIRATEKKRPVVIPPADPAPAVTPKPVAKKRGRRSSSH